MYGLCVKCRLGSLYVVHVQYKKSRLAVAAMVNRRDAKLRTVFGCVPEGYNAVEYVS